MEWNEVAAIYHSAATATPAKQPPELEPEEEQFMKDLKEDIVRSCRSFEAEKKVASNFPRRSSGLAVVGAPLLDHALALQGALQNLVPQLRQQLTQSELSGRGIQLHRRASKHRRRRRRRRTQAPRRRPKHRRRRTQAPRRRPKHKHRTAAKRSRGGAGGFRSSSRTKKKM